LRKNFSLYTWMRQELDSMKRKHPDTLRIGTAGRSADGRCILEAVLGTEKAPVHILIQASMHGREYINTKLAVKQLWRSLEHGDMETYPHVCLHVLPMVNPDGVVISQMGPEGIKSRRLREILEQCRQNDCRSGRETEGGKDYWKRWKANARGVDLNRNFSAGWDSYQGPASPSAWGYRGRYAGSEKETQAVLSIHRRYPLACVLSYHSSGEMIFWDYGGSKETEKLERRLAFLAAEVTGYRLVSVRGGKEDRAGCSDYFVLKEKVPAITIENGRGDCPLEEGELADIWKANRRLWQKVMGQY
jgi:g-D-glutamyl-meso-diaminopimelate peptidase